MNTMQAIKHRIMSTTDFSVTLDEIRAIDTELERTVERIAAVLTFDEAEGLLNHLGELQELLATMWFKYDIPITPRQKALVRKFDRCDDPDLCRHVVEEIKAKRFLMM